MAKTCGDCEKSTVEDVKVKNNQASGLCRCSVTGKVHPSDFQCDVADKPRLCEVLGVDVGERFRVNDGEGGAHPVFYIDAYGGLCKAETDSLNIGIFWLTLIINHPDRIERLPRLTLEEVQRCKTFGAKWVSRDTGADQIDLWAHEPGAGKGQFSGGTLLAKAWFKLFPSVQPGQLVQVEDEP